MSETRGASLAVSLAEEGVQTSIPGSPTVSPIPSDLVPSQETSPPCSLGPLLGSLSASPGAL